MGLDIPFFCCKNEKDAGLGLLKNHDELSIRSIHLL
jgi:hypothetical protein